MNVICPVCCWENDHTHVDPDGRCWCWNCAHEWELDSRVCPECEKVHYGHMDQCYECWSRDGDRLFGKPAPVKIEIGWGGLLIAIGIGWLLSRCTA